MDTLNPQVQARPRRTPKPRGTVALQSHGSQSNEVSSHSPEKRTVLCVNGDPDARRTLSEGLCTHELVLASGGYDALRQINARPFDLYLLEFWLPDWSGVSLCREIRKVDPHVPVFFSTSYAQAQDEARARRAGANAYFLKPVDPQLLKEHATRFLDLAIERDKAAHEAAHAALEHELAKRFAVLGSTLFSASFDATLKRIARRKAREAFLGSGGTLASFERRWDALWARRSLNAPHEQRVSASAL